MTVACYLEPTKLKTGAWVQAVAKGFGAKVVSSGRRERKATDHILFGNWPVASRLIDEFKKDNTGFWFCDSAYIRGETEEKYLRIERRRFWPGPMDLSYPMNRALKMGVRIKPWRQNGDYVLVAQHGPKFGIPWGIDIIEWNDMIVDKVKAKTDRPILVRPKLVTPIRPLGDDLSGAYCVVTHSSTIAVQAVLEGIPVFVESTNPAAMVGRVDLEIEDPIRPEREPWISSLAWRQWSKSEIASGQALKHIMKRECG